MAVPESLMQSLWRGPLTSTLHPIMATIDGQPLQTAADLADKIYAALPSTSSIPKSRSDIPPFSPSTPFNEVNSIIFKTTRKAGIRTAK